MRTLVLLILLVPLAGATGCGDDIECLLDTDCEAGLVCTDQTCGPPGAFDSGPADAETADVTTVDMSVTDAGVDDMGVLDARPAPDSGSADADMCMVDGEYDLTLMEGDMAACPNLSCAMSLTDVVVTLACGDIAPTCTIGDGCVCAGTGPIMLGGAEADLSVDFAGLSMTVTAPGSVCSYVMIRR